MNGERAASTITLRASEMPLRYFASTWTEGAIPAMVSSSRRGADSSSPV